MEEKSTPNNAKPGQDGFNTLIYIVLGNRDWKRNKNKNWTWTWI